MADKELLAELRATGRWLHRLTGYSPGTGHAEPGWAVDLPLATACEIGHRFKQDAIYYVITDLCHVTFCESHQQELGAGRLISRTAESRTGFALIT